MLPFSRNVFFSAITNPKHCSNHARPVRGANSFTNYKQKWETMCGVCTKACMLRVICKHNKTRPFICIRPVVGPVAI